MKFKVPVEYWLTYGDQVHVFRTYQAAVRWAKSNLSSLGLMNYILKKVYRHDRKHR